MIVNVSAVNVLVQEVNSVLVEALNYHSLVGEAGQLFVDFVISPFEFYIADFDQQVLGQVAQVDFLSGLVF